MAEEFWTYVNFTGEDQCEIDAYKDAYRKLMTQHSDLAEPVLSSAYQKRGGPLQMDVSYFYPSSKYDNDHHAIWANPAIIESFIYEAEGGEKVPLTRIEFLLHEIVHSDQNFASVFSMLDTGGTQAPNSPDNIISTEQQAMFGELQRNLLHASSKGHATKILETFWDNGGKEAMSALAEAASSLGNSQMDDRLELPPIRTVNKLREREGRPLRSENYHQAGNHTSKELFVATQLSSYGFFEPPSADCQADVYSQNRQWNEFNHPETGLPAMLRNLRNSNLLRQ